MEVYQRGHVTVDDNFARFGSKSYAINKITSVDVRTHEKRSAAWLIFGIVGGLLLLAGLGGLQGPEASQAIPFLVIGGLFMIPAVMMYRSRISRSYELMLATAAGEVQATTAVDGEAIQELRDAIESRVARSAA